MSMVDTPAAPSPSSAPIEATISARKLWLTATCQSDLDEVERLYRWALSSRAPHHPTNERDSRGDRKDEPPKKKAKSRHCGLNQTQIVQSGERLALLLCQSGRCKKAKRGLASIGFTCRLAKQVLDYPFEPSIVTTSHDSDTMPNNRRDGKRSSICQIIDNFLSVGEMERLRSVFASPTANYWIHHNYTVEPPSPYFSYVISLDEVSRNGDFGFMGRLIQNIMSCPFVNDKFPKLQEANYVELWAHNRPHASGHQMVS